MKMFDHSPGTTLEERDYTRTKTWTLRAPMLALSNPDSALAFPVGTILQPQLFVRNTLEKPIEVSVRFVWRTTDTSGKVTAPVVH